MAFEYLLKPGQIGPLRLKNRIIFASHSTNFCDETGEVSETLINYMARRAKGGVGLIVSELLLAARNVSMTLLHPAS